MRMEEQQWYLRAEPSPDGRRALLRHQERLATLFHALALHPRLIESDDLHWTALFLDSPNRWRRCFQNLGIRNYLAPEEFHHLAETLMDRRRETHAAPRSYDVFYTGSTHAVFVLRLSGTERTTQAAIEHLRHSLRQWERLARLPRQTTDRVFRSPDCPLARDLHDKKAHVTLARGRVSRARQRDVLRTLRSTALVSDAPMTFAPGVIRVVGQRSR